jgi:hypothetical protein
VAVVVVAYEARIVSGPWRTSPEALEIAAFLPEAIPWDGIELSTSLWAIGDWVRRVRPDLPVPTRTGA